MAKKVKLKVFPLAKFCEALIDQRCFIGSDPIGRSCMQKAVVTTDYGHSLCLECEKLLDTGRITLIPKRCRLADFQPDK